MDREAHDTPNAFQFFHQAMSSFCLISTWVEQLQNYSKNTSTSIVQCGSHSFRQHPLSNRITSTTITELLLREKKLANCIAFPPPFYFEQRRERGGRSRCLPQRRRRSRASRRARACRRPCSPTGCSARRAASSAPPSPPPPPPAPRPRGR